MRRCHGCAMEVDEEEFILNGGYCDYCLECLKLEEEWMLNHGYGVD